MFSEKMAIFFKKTAMFFKKTAIFSKKTAIFFQEIVGNTLMATNPGGAVDSKL